MRVIPVILCGGTGRRLDPVRPKQFKALLGVQSLLQETAGRALRVTGANTLLAATQAAFEGEVRTHLPGAYILSEPQALGTALAVDGAARYVAQHFGLEAVMWVTPADHYVGNEHALLAALEAGQKAAQAGYLVLFGIEPTSPETGYGYIRAGDTMSDGAFNAAQFSEKPDIHTAEKYLHEGWLWNSGMFMGMAQTFINEGETHKAAIGMSFDKAVLEHSDKVVVVPCDLDWSDIGTPQRLEKIQLKAKSR